MGIGGHAVVAEDTPTGFDEAAERLGVSAHVLRVWGERFAGAMDGAVDEGFDRHAMAFLRGVRHLVNAEGKTLREVERLIRDNGAAAVVAIGGGVGPAPRPPPDARALWDALRPNLEQALASLDKARAIVGDDTENDTEESTAAPQQEEAIEPQ